MQRVVDNAYAIREKPAGLKASQKVLNISEEMSQLLLLKPYISSKCYRTLFFVYSLTLFRKKRQDVVKTCKPKLSDG
jgi:hypothetical protein